MKRTSGTVDEKVFDSFLLTKAYKYFLFFILSLNENWGLKNKCVWGFTYDTVLKKWHGSDLKMVSLS